MQVRVAMDMKPIPGALGMEIHSAWTVPGIIYYGVTNPSTTIGVGRKLKNLGNIL